MSQSLRQVRRVSGGRKSISRVGTCRCGTTSWSYCQQPGHSWARESFPHPMLTVPALALHSQISSPHEPTMPLLALSRAFPLANISHYVTCESPPHEWPWFEQCVLKRLSPPAACHTPCRGHCPASGEGRVSRVCVQAAGEFLKGLLGGHPTLQTGKESPPPHLDSPGLQ